MDYSIILNLSKTGHGCSRKCSYCNWRNSEELPHGIQSKEAVSNFVKDCDKDLITLSGGGDPLWNLEENITETMALINFIKHDLGKKVRVITREVKKLHMLSHLVDYWSISLDNQVMKEIGNLPSNVEYSIVLPPLDTTRLVKHKPYYLKLLNKLKQPLVLRENLNSFFPLNYDALSFSGPIKILGKRGCLESRYLVNNIVTGYDIMPDRRQVILDLIADKDLYLFGGFVKHYISGGMQSYDDIDIIARGPVEGDFRVTGWKMKGKTIYEQLVHNKDSSLKLHVMYVNELTHKEIKHTILNAQLDVDRAFIHNKRLICDKDLTQKIINKEASYYGTNLNAPFFNKQSSFNIHKNKLILKGFRINADNVCR